MQVTLAVDLLQVVMVLGRSFLMKPEGVEEHDYNNYQS